ncbi:hypothetical protein DBR06_SOUSAS35810016, partial [Sousa chinensis]
MRRAGLGKKRAEILSSGALKLAVLGAGTRKEIRSVSCLWNLNQRAGCIEGSLEAIPSGNTPFVRDPGAFLKFSSVPGVDGEGVPPGNYGNYGYPNSGYSACEEENERLTESLRNKVTAIKSVSIK